MSEEENEFVKVDALKPRLRNVNATAKIVNIGEPRSVTSRRDGSVHRVAERSRDQEDRDRQRGNKD